MILTFDKETHTYFVDGKKVPGVTELLPKEEFHLSPAELEIKRLHGEEQHEAQFQYLNEGETFSFDQEFICSLDDFMRDFSTGLSLGSLIGAETILYSKKYRFAGRPDAFFTGGLVDRKRSAGSKKIRALQFAGYWIMILEAGHILPPKWWTLVYDAAKKRHVPKNVFDPMAESVFLSLVQSYWNRTLLETYMRRP